MILIRNAELLSDGGAPVRGDLRIRAGRIAEMGPSLPPAADEAVIDAAGAAALPGLHDHHLHLFATAAAMASVACGPPLPRDVFAQKLAQAPATPWVRAVGYHELVAGEIDRVALDRIRGDAPLRVQHRSGRLWVFNSAGLDRLLSGYDGPVPLERAHDGPHAPYTGRLYDGDAWLAARLRGMPPDLTALGRMLAARGVTGVTDTGANNTAASAATLAAACAAAGLRQSVFVMGQAGDQGIFAQQRLPALAVKLHLHDGALPDPDATIALIRDCHDRGQPVAVHAVTDADLVFTLAAFDAAGTIAGDRLEHASQTPQDLLPWIARLGLCVVTQPHFIAERGDAYGISFLGRARHDLYRLRSFLRHRIPLAGGSDAPYGDHDPWAAMHAATTRRSADGTLFGVDEALTPAQALALFLGPAHAPGGPPRSLRPGAPADVILLDRPWAQAALRLDAVRLRLTLCAGQIAYQHGAPQGVENSAN